MSDELATQIGTILNGTPSGLIPMAIVSSIRGGLILASAVILALVGHRMWILPVVVLIVALHFFPMPWILRRTIDYYLGTGMLIAAATGLFLSAEATLSW